MDIVSSAGTIGTTLGFLAAYLLLLKVIRSANTLNVMLFTLIFSLSWILLVNTLNVSGLIIKYPHIFRTGVPTGFILGPACYLYIRAYLKREKKNNYSNYLHFLPTALIITDLAPFLFKSTAEKQGIIRHYVEDSNTILFWNEGTFISNWLLWFVCLYTLVYMGLSLKKIYTNSKEAQVSQQGSMSNAELKWLLSLVICVSVTALAFLWSVATKSEYHLAYTTWAVISGLSFLALTFMLFHKPHILYGEEKMDTTVNKYMPFDDNQLESYAVKVRCFIEESKCFLTTSYTLDDLAQDTNIGRRQLSIIINHGIGMKFTEMMNRLRIEYLMQHYGKVNHRNLTIEGIASEVGFNSRTTFFHSVKKFTGLTPTEFVKRLENNDKPEIQSGRIDDLYKS